MRIIALTLLLCLSLNAHAKTTPAREVARFEEDVLDGKLPERAQKALTTLFGVAYGELAKRGHRKEAEEMINEWRNKQSAAFLGYAKGNRDIGDHESWNKWLGDKLQMLRFVLGDEILNATHIADLYVFLFAPPVVFRPCSFPMDFVTGERIDEYRRHFNEGESFYGLTSVIVYWSVYAGVTFATSGTGFVFISGIIGTIGEKLYASFVGPRLSDFTYNTACSEGFASNPNNLYY